MKKANVIILSAALVAALSGCSSYKNTAKAFPFPAKNTVFYDSVFADFDWASSAKIEGSAKFTYFAGLKLSGGNKRVEKTGAKASKIQSAALYDALEKSDYEMVINPQYKTEIHSYFFGFVKIKKANVKGLGVNVKQYYHQK